MIVVETKGGLGNQLFQYAVARRLAELHETELKLDVSWNKLYGARQDHYLGHFNTPENFASIQEIAQARRFKERYYHFDPDVLSLGDNVHLVGYWQSEKYFLEIEPIVRREFTLRNGLEEVDKELAASMFHSNSVSLHIRRTDYLPGGIHGVCSPSFYLRCLACLEENFEIDHVFVFGDDIGWAQRSLQLIQPTVYVTPSDIRGNTCRDFYLMSLCKYHILANSTFSWWAAWLCQREDKVILAPRPWFLSPGNRDEKDLIPNTWVRIER